MNKKKFFAGLVFIVLLLAVFVVADFTLKTQSGDLLLYPAGLNVKAGNSSSKVNVSVYGDSRVYYDNSNFGRFYADSTGDAHMDSSGDDMEFGTKAGYGGYFLFYHGTEYGNCDYDSELRLFGDGVNHYLTLKHDGTDANFLSTGDVIFNPTGNDVVPSATNTHRLGTNSSAWKSVSAYDLWDVGDTEYLGRGGVLRKYGKSALELISGIKETDDSLIDTASLPDYYVGQRGVDMTFENCTLLPDSEKNLEKKVCEKYTVRDPDEVVVNVNKRIALSEMAIQELKEENNFLKQELCKKDNMYGFCK